MIRLHLQDNNTVEVEDMDFSQAADIHARREGTFRVMARSSGRTDLPFQQQSIAVEHVVRIVEVAS